MSNSPYGTIINPLSGARGPDIRRLVETFQSKELEWQIKISSSGEDIPSLVDELAETGCQTVALWGGDGTISRALPRLLHHHLPLNILPGGSANLLARQLGVPLDPYQALDAYLSGPAEELELDVFKTNLGLFVLRGEVGVHARVIEQADRDHKSRLGWLAYWIEGLREYTNATGFAATLKGDDETTEHDDLVTCFLGNAPTLNLGGQELEAKECLKDGKLHLVSLRLIHLEGLAQFTNTLKEAFTEIEDLELSSTSTLTVETPEPQPVILDGEPAGSTPLDVSLHPKRLRVEVPVG